MGASKPKVAAAVLEISEIIKNNSNRFLVKTNDANALSKAILKISSDSGFAEKYGAKALSLPGRDFTSKLQPGKMQL
jgi:glycosyltransferase involved in cell wall biosynthesis